LFFNRAVNALVPPSSVSTNCNLCEELITLIISYRYLLISSRFLFTPIFWSWASDKYMLFRLFILVVCRLSLTANGFRLCVRAGFGAQNCQPALNLNRSTKLQVYTSVRLTQNPC